jgi:hypothetical protein
MVTLLSNVFIETLISLIWKRHSPHSIELEESLGLRQSQEQTIRSYPKPLKSGHKFTSYFFKIHINVTLISIPRSPKSSLTQI